MALCNDNFWGYTSDIIFKYKVRWLEAAIVQTCWTTMMVCYVEGDFGHLMGEELHQQKYRTKVRGTAHSFALPWEEIVAELERNCMQDNVAQVLPRPPDCLKYVLTGFGALYGSKYDQIGSHELSDPVWAMPH